VQKTWLSKTLVTRMNMPTSNARSKFKPGDWVRLGPAPFAIKAQVLWDTGQPSIGGGNRLYLMMEPIEPGEEVTLEMGESHLVPIE
jgi:hypothetical protein